MDDFIETPRLPTRISYGSGGGPMFKTFLMESLGAVEARQIAWADARAVYNVNFGDLDGSEMDTLRAFFMNCRGKARGFRFKDFSDFEATDSPIGTGDGSNRVFNLTKRYGSGTLLYDRRIYKPVSGTLAIKVNGVTNSNWTADYTTGVVTFNVGQAPANGHAVTASFEFDVPVRFDTDELQASHHVHDSLSWSGVDLVELNLG